MEDLLQVGAITSTHGIKGEVKVFPTTSDVNRFKNMKEVLLDTGKEKLTLEVEGVKYFKQYVILKFKQFNDINEIEKYRGKNLYVTRENAIKLEQDEYFVADLMGMVVYLEDGTEFGKVWDVIETGANDVYEVERLNGEHCLLPAIKECILKIDMEQKKMTVHIMEGLLD